MRDDSLLIGKSTSELHFYRRFQVNLLAVSRRGERTSTACAR